jgi:hypothetical protein
MLHAPRVSEARCQHHFLPLFKRGCYQPECSDMGQVDLWIHEILPEVGGVGGGGKEKGSKLGAPQL